ncbi:hypothetical protein ACGF07_31950 [Kitasatospora sp. NPDC048194]|uniref:hypothetical protein n=1 Tax=Kitasatospora sp. NPDC048194 TaxID=3364045 RepID=UPI00372002FD
MATQKKVDAELRIRRAGGTVRRNLTLSASAVETAEELAEGRSLSLIVDEALAQWNERTRRSRRRTPPP